MTARLGSAPADVLSQAIEPTEATERAFLGGGSGHWVAVLGEQPAKQGKKGSTDFLLYDPDSKHTVHAYIVRDSELARVIVYNGTFGIVSA